MYFIGEKISNHTNKLETFVETIPVRALSKLWVCILCLEGIAGSNLVGGMNVRLLLMVCIMHLEVSAISRSLDQGSTAKCVCVYVCRQVGIVECDQV